MIMWCLLPETCWFNKLRNIRRTREVILKDWVGSSLRFCRKQKRKKPINIRTKEQLVSCIKAGTTTFCTWLYQCLRSGFQKESPDGPTWSTDYRAASEHAERNHCKEESLQMKLSQQIRSWRAPICSCSWWAHSLCGKAGAGLDSHTEWPEAPQHRLPALVPVSCPGASTPWAAEGWLPANSFQHPEDTHNFS